MKKLIVILTIIFLIALPIIAGLRSRPAEPERPAASLVCLMRDTAIRESPTGYIILRLPKGAQMFVNRIEAPFAYVSYFDGTQWIEGSVTASYLGVCGTENKVEG